MNKYNGNAIRSEVCQELGWTNYIDGITDLYINQSMSAVEISEYFLSLSIVMSPRSIQRTLAKLNLIRDRRKSYNLAIKRKRFKNR